MSEKPGAESPVLAHEQEILLQFFFSNLIPWPKAPDIRKRCSPNLPSIKDAVNSQLSDTLFEFIELDD